MADALTEYDIGVATTTGGGGGTGSAVGLTSTDESESGFAEDR